MWEKLSKPWQACFEEVWDAYCKGSVPIRAVIVSAEGEIISRGRNRINEETKELNKLSGSRIAHAEMNAIYSCEEGVRNSTIYSSMEPCVMCFGTIIMNSIKEVYYGARDGLAGGLNLRNSYIDKKNIKIHEHNSELEIVQLVIKTDYIYRNYSERADEMLGIWGAKCPLGIELGRKWYQEGRLPQYKEAQYTIEQVVENICKEAGI